MVRRLAAILAADVVGYSRLIREAEASTLAALKAHREEVIAPKLTQYHGRVVKLMGDGLLAEFPSAVEAVQCAVEMQHLFRERNAEVPERRRMTYRMGINIGDIVVQDDDIYGDGVNVAARLEGLAESDGICVARNVYNQVKDKLDLTFEHLGERGVKNIAEPVTVYRIALDDKAAELVTPVLPKAATPERRRWPVAMGAIAGLVLLVGGALWWRPWAPDIERASVEKMAFPLPDKPSIAVLPFANLSADPEQEYFADGITNALITDLAKFKNLFVIAANSTFTYKGKPVKVQAVAEDLGVRYVLEGSVQRAGDTIRINAQLIDAVSGHHLWADRYDHDLKDIFALQNEVVDQVLSALSVELEAGEQHGLKPTETLSPESYELFVHARTTLPAYFADNDDLLEARQLFERVVERAPDFSGGYAGLSLTYSLAVMRGYTRTPVDNGNKALELAQKALELDAESEFSMLAMASALQAVGRLEDAIATLEKLVRGAPSSADAHAQLGLLLIWAGRAEDAIEPIQTAIRLNPYLESPYLIYLGLANFTLGQYDAAITAFEMNSSRSGPIDDAGLAVWAASYSELGQSNEAAATLTRLINRYPDIYLGSFWLPRRYARLGDRERLIEIFKRADIPVDRPYTR